MLLASTADDLEAVNGLALRVALSRPFDPAWAAEQQRQHEQRMAQGRQQQQHAQAMAAISRQGHLQRMHDIQAWGQMNTRMHEDRMAQMDARHQSWMAGQAESDARHQSWMDLQARDDAMQQSAVNAIREEHTVADASGTEYQVDIHHERYFVNKKGNTYIGADAATELYDLGRTHGVNPDDFEEVKVVR